MTRRIFYSPEAMGQIELLDAWIAEEASPTIASRFTNSLLEHCNSLADFPNRGTPRDDIRPGMRTTAFRRRATIAYSVEGDDVLILAVFYRGQDFETNWHG